MKRQSIAEQTLAKQVREINLVIEKLETDIAKWENMRNGMLNTRAMLNTEIANLSRKRLEASERANAKA